MPATVTVDNSGVLIGLGELKAATTDVDVLLRICGEIMRKSVAYTFREEGSPAGSWPELAASTKKKKGYGAGHKLLILSGRLFGSITYEVSAGVLTIGTNVVYAAVHQYGSKDFSFGPRTKAQHEATVDVAAHQGLRVKQFRQYGKEARVGKDGRTRMVRVRAQGPDHATRFGVKAHTRHQHIPPRPFLVFRPEDPELMASAVERFFAGKAVRIGKVGAA